jgi:ADP-ribose pyrophosphatase
LTATRDDGQSERGHGPRIVDRAVVFTTPWFEVQTKTVADLPGTAGDEVFYGLSLPDYVSVLAITERDEVVLVRQYRPILEKATLELPSGGCDPGETPDQAARRELLEETGYASDAWRLLGSLHTDVGRLDNRVWCFLAANAYKISTHHQPEPGVEACTMPLRDVYAATASQLDQAETLAVLGLALVQGLIRVR